MTNAPRTLLNRILLGAIAIMTLAIFALGTAMIYLFITGGSDEEATAAVPNANVELGAILEASNELGKALYRIPTTCRSVVLAQEGEITVFLPQPSCEGAQVISTEGDIAIAYPAELSQ